MATLYRDPIRRKNPKTGKIENAYDKNGKQLFHPNWPTIVYTHDYKRRSVTFGTNKSVALKNAEMLETRERQIRSGVRALPTPEDENITRPIEDVLNEYFSWGKARGGRRNMPWDDEYADKKERNLAYWCECLGLKELGDVYGIMKKVESECHKMLADGKAGKTVTNKVLDLRALIKWCNKRKYLTEDPLSELGKFDTTPQIIRRAMTVEELRSLLSNCAPHRRLLYEVAFCSGLREDELRKLEPDMLDREECALRIPREIDKGRKNRIQYIPAALLERLLASGANSEARTIYDRTYHNQGKRIGKKKPPKNPLLYVPTNSSTMLKRDLKAADIPIITAKGKLDFHALRTAYINFVLDVAPDVKTAQELARHETADMTLNVYGRAKEDRGRSVVEKVGSLVFEDSGSHAVTNVGQAKPPINPRGHENQDSEKIITPDMAGGYNQENMVRKRGLEPTEQQNASMPQQYQSLPHSVTSLPFSRYYRQITHRPYAPSCRKYVSRCRITVQDFNRATTEFRQNLSGHSGHGKGHPWPHDAHHFLAKPSHFN